jgi:hypothetical protein
VAEEHVALSFRVGAGRSFEREERIGGVAPRDQEAEGRVDVGFNEDNLVPALVSPHANMNFAVRGRDAEDVAAYIATLAR